jgi:glutamine amidotransferase
MRVVVVDYGSGNLRSAVKAFERAARESGVSAEIILSAQADQVANADRVVLPGVGAYADCRAGLNAIDGMADALRHAVEEKARPFLGICVGMQLMSSRGLEKTTSEGFDWIAGDVVEITPSNPALKIPQIGWNTLDLKMEHPLFEGIPTGALTVCMPISFIPIIWRLRMMRMSSRPVIMAGRSRRRLPMTTRPALSSTRKRARRWASP